MNLPNKLTIFRVILIPFFLIFINMESKFAILGALIIFIVASITDQIDGYIARKYNLITDFGKFMDPLADKLLVSAACISFVGLNLVHSIPIIIIISREFIVTGVRLILASKNGKVVAANMGGKIKTVFQIIFIILVLLGLYLSKIESNLYTYIKIAADVCLYISVLLTIISGWDYINKNIENLKEVM